MKPILGTRLSSRSFPLLLAATLALGALQNAAATPDGFAANHDASGTKLIDDKVHCDFKTPMAHYNFHTQVVSLNIMDTPVGYTPPRGPDMHFTVTYNQREVLPEITSALPLPNFGSKWVCNWVASLDDISYNADQTTVHLPGGGSEYFCFRCLQFTALQSGAVMTQHLDPSPAATYYERMLPDGSRQVFGLNTGTFGARRFYMTKLIDPTGQESHFNYDPSFRLTSVTDALGQSFTVSYLSNNPSILPDYYLIQRVEDFAQRAATFEYQNGKLWKIHDAIGITSAFRYNEHGEYDADFITSMITPYGLTTFSQPVSLLPQAEGARTLQAVEPDGGIERLEYQQGSGTGIDPYDPNLPEGVFFYNGLYDNRNSFYWDKKAMAMYPPDPNGIPNFSKAKITHWLHVLCYDGVISNIKEREKWPLENPIYYRYAGQGGCDVGLRYPAFTGTQGAPSVVARRLDDGTQPHVTQLALYEHNNRFQKLTKSTDPVGRVTSYKYAPNDIDLIAVYQRNQSGNSVDPDGFPADKIFSCTYNTSHQPLIATDAAGQTTVYTYTVSKQLETVTNARMETTTYRYGDGSAGKPTGYLTTIISPSINGSSAMTSFTYDGAHRVHTVTTSPDNYTVTTDYDNLDRPTQITYPDGTTEQFVYTDIQRGMTLDLTASKDRLNRWTNRHYNSDRQMDSITDPLNRLTQYGWCTCGSLTSITDANFHVTTFIRDLQSRLTSKVFADGTPNSTTTNYTYENTTSRLKSMTDALNQITNYQYRTDDNLEQITYANAQRSTPMVTFSYDPYYNRVTSMTTAGIGIKNYAYYSVGANPTLGATKLHTVSGPFTNDTITYTYDELGRVLAQDINGTSAGVTYDSLGRLGTTTNALGSFARDYDGVTPRLQTLTYPNEQTANYAYFGNDHDRRLQTLDNLTPLARLSQFDYAYDAEGQIMSWHRELETTPSERWFDYDSARQLKSAHDAQDFNNSTSALDFDYDLAGNRTSDYAHQPILQNGGGRVRHDYTANALNQIDHVVTTVNLSPSTQAWLTYDADGNMTYDGGHLGFEWDAANRLSAINHTDTGERTEFAYDGLGRRIKITEYGPGVIATIQPKGINYTPFNTAPFTLPAGSYTLTFEGLTSKGANVALIDAVTLNNTLVANGSFESPDVSSSQGGYEFNPPNATWSFTGATGIAFNASDFTYKDAPDGQQVSFIQSAGVISQTCSVSAGTYTLSFQAAQGGANTADQQLRVTLRPSTAAVKIKTFVWCGNQICEERDSSGATVTKRFFAEGEQRIGGSDAGNYYYSRDHLGSIREVTDSDGHLRAQYDYDPYGNSVVVAGDMNVDFGYTGHYFHASSGLNLTLYRAYNPALGRWLSRDPIENAEMLQGANLYAYVANDPIRLVDPLGLAAGDWWDARTWFNRGFTDSLSSTWTSLQDGTGDVFTGNWDRLATDAAGNPLGQTENCPAAYYTEVGLLTVSGVAATTALAAGLVEATTGIRVEIHGTHGRDIWPHLQGIRGPGWGKTLWRWPGH